LSECAIGSIRRVGADRSCVLAPANQRHWWVGFGESSQSYVWMGECRSLWVLSSSKAWLRDHTTTEGSARTLRLIWLF